ncbi:hypothetical protein ASF30_01930 [Leifsonia sp. Leaf264]|nr:hypothetical protein ASF30_01930 [Leifsonia sp. Leaf264]
MAARATERIERKLSSNTTRLTPEEFRSRPDIVGAIPDTQVSEAVEAIMRIGTGNQYRMAELLYVMAIQGRNDYREGWLDAECVLAWVNRRYPNLRTRAQQGHFTDGVGPRPPAPKRLEWRPESVLKRDGRTPDFALRQLLKGVSAALWGRRDADAKSLIVAHLVLNDLRGQRAVHSTQVSASVLAGLRRVDDIGYLRWATVAKNIRGVREFADEVDDLIRAPSHRLIVSKDWRRWARAL